MVIQVFFLDKEKYNSVSLRERIISDILGYEANWIFHDKVIDILTTRYPMESRDADEKCQIDSMLAARNTSFECKRRLIKLYESEFGKIPDKVTDEIKEIAFEYAQVALKSCKWIDTEEK